MSAQRRASAPAQSEDNPTSIGDERFMDSRYMWNSNMLKDFKA